MLGTRLRLHWMAFAQVMLLISVDCWIVRLPCIDQERFNNFTVVYTGYALESNMVAAYGRMELDECKSMCLDEYRCRSINHSESEKRCELNDKINETAKRGDLKEKNGYTYLATDYSMKNIGPTCQELNPCVTETYCIDRCFAPGYKCVKCPKYHEIRYEQYCQLKDFVNRFYEMRNIAIGKPTSQSSTTLLISSHSDTANDGDASCMKYSNTKLDENPFWRVDLQRPAVVLNVTVIPGPKVELFSPFNIHVGDTTANGGRDNPICIAGATLQQGEIKTFACPETEGRYVSINTYKVGRIQLCEVEVYGIYL